MDPHIWFSEEVLKAQDGKKVPLTLGPDGPVIGEATLKYVSGTDYLMVDAHVTDPKIVKALSNWPKVPNIFSIKES